jgi:hypothetical protein
MLCPKAGCHYNPTVDRNWISYGQSKKGATGRQAVSNFKFKVRKEQEMDAPH